MKKLIHSSKVIITTTIILTSLLLNLAVKHSISALTYQSEHDISFTFNPVLSLDLSSSDLVISNLTPGTSADSNIITVSIATNASQGYYLAATVGTSSGNTDLTNTENSSYKFTNLSANAASLSNFASNTWGYSYSTDDGSTWISGSQGSTASGYNGLPLDNDDDGATGVTLIDTNSPADSTSVKFKIGAKSGETQAAGTYTNVVNFYAITNPDPAPGTMTTESGCIRYYPNGAGVAGTMGCQEVTSSATSAMLLASNFSRQGYGFAGWSDVPDYTTNANAHFYGPQEDITFTAGQYTSPNPGLSLYAVWVPSTGYLQNSTTVASLCGTSPTTGTLKIAPTDGTANLSSVSALTDQRDNETYAIARLADGNCWMIENLRLESTAAHNSDGTLAQGYGTSTTYGNFSGLANAESANFSDSTTANSIYYSGTQSGDATVDIGTTDYPGYRMPRYNNYNHKASPADRPQNPTTNSATNDTTNSGMYSYGNYYTWPAAIADTTYYSSGDHGTTSLCPKGWRLPIGKKSTANLSFGKLSVELGGPAEGASADSSSTPTGKEMSKIFRSYPNNFLYSGYFSTSSANNRGSSGFYWSSAAIGVGAYYLNFYNTNLNPGNNYGNKIGGYSIGCIVSPSA